MARVEFRDLRKEFLSRAAHRFQTGIQNGAEGSSRAVSLLLSRAVRPFRSRAVILLFSRAVSLFLSLPVSPFLSRTAVVFS